MTGFVERFRIASPWREWLPVLAMGEVVHAGAGVTFGFGRYRTEAG